MRYWEAQEQFINSGSLHFTAVIFCEPRTHLALHTPSFQGRRRNLAAVVQRCSASARQEEKRQQSQRAGERRRFKGGLRAFAVGICCPLQLTYLGFDCVLLSQVSMSVPCV